MKLHWILTDLRENKGPHILVPNLLIITRNLTGFESRNKNRALPVQGNTARLLPFLRSPKFHSSLLQTQVIYSILSTNIFVVLPNLSVVMGVLEGIVVVAEEQKGLCRVSMYTEVL